MDGGHRRGLLTVVGTGFVLLTIIYSNLVPKPGGRTPALRFCHEVEYWAVFFSGFFAVLVYILAQRRSWLESLNSRDLAVFLNAIALVVTAGTTVWCAVTIGEIDKHVWALSTFFLVFVLWDSLMWVSGKKTARDWQGIVREANETTARWFWYVDLPSAVLVILAYKLGTYGLGGARNVDRESLELVMSGVDVALLIRGMWEWMLEMISILQLVRA